MKRNLDTAAERMKLKARGLYRGIQGPMYSTYPPSNILIRLGSALARDSLSASLGGRDSGRALLLPSVERDFCASMT